MAKFGAITQLLFVNSAREPVDVVARRSRGADHGVDAGVGQPGQVLAGRVDLGEVDGHVDPGIEHRLGAGRHLQGQVDADHLAQVEPGVERIDGHGQLELGVVRDGLAHRGAHASACPEDTDPDHRP